MEPVPGCLLTETAASSGTCASANTYCLLHDSRYGIRKMPLLHRSYSNSRYRGGRVTSYPTAYPLAGSRYTTGMPYDVFGAMKAKCLPIGVGFERLTY